MSTGAAVVGVAGAAVAGGPDGPIGLAGPVGAVRSVTAGQVTEMTALQRLSAARVATPIFSVQAVVPVLAAPWLTGEQVQETLRILEERWQREGPFDQVRMHELLQEIRAARAGLRAPDGRQPPPRGRAGRSGALSLLTLQ